MRLWRLALLTLGVAQMASAQAPAGEHVYSVAGYVGEWDETSGDWFELFGPNIRLALPDGAERETYWQLLVAASERGVALRVRFDATAGRLTPDGTSVIYPLCSISAGNASFGNESNNCPVRNSERRDGETLLTLGLAQVSEQPEAGRRTLTDALSATPQLAPRARALAFKGRADAAEAIADNLESDDPETDRLLAEALADFRRQVALAPDDAAAMFSVARLTMSLGGYAEALDLYRAVGRRWPEEALNVAVRSGALYRQQGDYERALRELDDYARLGDPQINGMKFRYHRAWTLSLLGRNEEAEREINTGLATQPDYSSAYQIRACVRARLGRLDEALADQERALELLVGIMAQPNAALRADIERSRRAVATLRGAIDARRPGPVAAPCEGYWDRWSRPRPRSPLLAAED